MKRICLLLITGLILVSLASPSVATEPKINLQTLLANRVPILLEFGRGWCKPCKYMKPILDDTAQAFSGRAIVTTVDMDANKDLVRDFAIRLMPTQVFLTPDGKEFFRNEGTLEKDQIVQVFSKMGIAVPTHGSLSGPMPQALMPRGN